ERHHDLAVLHLTIANLRIHELLRLKLAANPLLLHDAASVIDDVVLDVLQRGPGHLEGRIERMTLGDPRLWRRVAVRLRNAMDRLTQIFIVVASKSAGGQARGPRGSHRTQE